MLRAMEVDGLGERYIEALGEFGQLDSMADLYRLTLDDLLELKRQADERDGTTPETVKAGKVATTSAENRIPTLRSEERRVGKECDSKFRSRRTPYPEKKKIK